MYRILMAGTILIGVLGVAVAGGGRDAASGQQPTVTPSVSGTATVVATATPLAEQAPYFSLGDSIADAEGASSRQLGYVPLFATEAWAILRLPGDPSQRADYGLRGGETSTTLLAPGGQLDRATAEISRRNSDADPANNVKLITIDIGGNDFLVLTRSTSPCRVDLTGQDCQQAVASVISTFAANYPVILQRVRAAAGPDAIIVAMAFYNPFSGTGQVIDAPGDLVAEGIAAQARAVAVSEPVNAVWVDLFALFRGRAPALTHIADEPSDIHPNDAGHAAITAAMGEALRAAVSPPPEPPDPPASGTGGASGTDAGRLAVLAGLALVLSGATSAIVLGARTGVRVRADGAANAEERFK